MMDKQTFHIKNVYKVLDDVNGGSVTIQQGDDVGLIDVDGVVITMEQVPGVIEVLKKLQNDALTSVKPTKLRKATVRSGSSDPPF